MTQVTIPAAHSIRALSDAVLDDWASPEPLYAAERAVLEAAPQNLADVALQLALCRDYFDRVERATDREQAAADATAARAALARAVAFLGELQPVDLSEFGGEYYGAAAYCVTAAA